MSRKFRRGPRRAGACENFISYSFDHPPSASSVLCSPPRRCESNVVFHCFIQSVASQRTPSVIWHPRNDSLKGPSMVVAWLGPGDMSEKPETPAISYSGRERAFVGSSKDLGIIEINEGLRAESVDSHDHGDGTVYNFIDMRKEKRSRTIVYALRTPPNNWNHLPSTRTALNVPVQSSCRRSTIKGKLLTRSKVHKALRLLP